jgi:hypothetical protein
MKHLLARFNPLALALLLCGFVPESKSASPNPDTHECGSSASTDFPKQTKVRLFFNDLGNARPTGYSMFFVNKNGEGYFSNLSKAKREELETIWGANHKEGESFKLWGEYAFDRVEKIRNPYWIDVRFRGDELISYRIRGPRIDSQNWQTLDRTEEKSE